ncbi:MAG TPA: PQQ-binding-like beta-propeller repeat protein, partial [Spirochaetota bacterium]|nr:PQQ-binding-like beta-propeller repeat protein [Spirochaetota bacterium]
GYVYIFDFNSGEELARFQVNTRAAHQPVFIDRDSFIIAGAEGCITVIKKNSIINRIYPGSVITTRPAVDGHIVYFGTGNGYFMACDIYDGKIYWSYKLRHSPAGRVFLKGKNVYFGVNDNNFYALVKETGSFRFLFKNTTPPSGEHLRVGKNLAYVTRGGKIRLLNSSGTLFWDYQAQSGLTTVPTHQNQNLLLPLSNASIDIISSVSGEQKLTLGLESDPVSRAFFVDKDLLSVITENGLIYSMFINWQ